MKKLRRASASVLSVILCFAVMMTLTVLPAHADEIVPVIVHYYNVNGWEDPYLYYYTEQVTPVVWPGVAMTDDGDDWYSYTISSFDEVRVIFSDNGSGQVPPQNQPGLLVSGENGIKTVLFTTRTRMN